MSCFPSRFHSAGPVALPPVPTISDRTAPYRALTPIGRIVAMGFGVVHPFSLTPEEMAKRLVLTRFDDEDNPLRHPSTRRRGFRASCGKVAEAGIVTSGQHGKLSASADWAPWLTLEAHRRAKLEGFERVFRDFLSPEFQPGYSYLSRRELKSRQRLHDEVMLRWRTVAERFGELECDGGKTGGGWWTWLVRPGVGHLLAKLPRGCADAALAECAPEVVRRAAAADPVLEAYRAGSADRVRHADAVAFIQILRGASDAALGVYADLAPEDRTGKAARIGLASTRAFLATLRGDDAEAARRIREAIAAERAGRRRRNVFPGPPVFALSLLSLVRSGTDEDSELLDHLLRVGTKKRGVHAPFLRAVILADHARQGLPLELDRDGHSGSPKAPSMDRLVDGLAGCWQGAGAELAGSGRIWGLDTFGIRAAESGYRWLAAECMEVSARLREAAGLSVEPLDRRYGLSSAVASTTVREAAAGVHRELGTTTLASLVAPMPEWERILAGVERLAEEAREQRPGSPTAGPDRRLAWTLDVSNLAHCTPTVREQRRYANREWSKGRPVALKRLVAEADGMRFLLDKDREATAQLVQEVDRWGNRGRYFLPISGIAALEGHPSLYGSDGDPLEVVEREPELLVVEEDGTLRARVEPHADQAVDEKYGVVATDGGRIEVTRFTVAHRRLCDTIPLEGVRLPLEAGERLVEAVTALAADVRVQGAFGAGSRATKQVDGDPRPLVRLERSGRGLAVALLVEPVEGSGAYFTPGTGGTTALVAAEGETVQARRDLVAERRAAQELTAACPALAVLGPDATATVSGLAECLEIVDQLQSADVRCIWPKGRPFRVAARADAGSLRLSGKSAAEWFGVSGALQLDGADAIDLRQLFELLDRSPGSRFMPMDDGSFLALTEGFRRQLEDLRSVSANRGKKQVRLHGLAALALADLFDRSRLSADREWRSLRERFESAGAYEPGTPPTLRAELRPYQEEGFRWLARLSRWGAGACLADDMGLGKTVQSLALLLERAADGPALVVAPTSVVSNWMDEARRFAPTLNPVPYTGPVAARAGKLESLGPYDLAVTTYGLLHNDVDALAAIEWSTVVLDEAQAIKNPLTQRARAARRLPARFRIVTTGTPIQNNVVDLYSLVRFLNPGLLGSARRFRKNFAVPIERDRDPEARHRLRRLTRPFVLRRLKSEVLDDLPPRTEITLHVELSADEAALYEALRQRAVDDLESLALTDPGSEAAGRGRIQVLAHLTRLRLAACHPRLVHPDGPPSSKLRTFAATLDELRQGGHKVLVFSQFVRHLKLIAGHMEEAGIPFQYLDGSTPAKARAERIAAFQRGKGDAFLISLRAGGFGLNLTAADYVIHMDPWWNPAAEDQASDRAHRIGQTRPVTVYRLVARGTIEEQIVELQRSKRELADRLLEGADAPGKLDTEELLALLSG